MARMRKCLAVLAAAGALGACKMEVEIDGAKEEESASAVGFKQAARKVDTMVGKDLFIDKGCVICHAVNGVGGKAAPALDAGIGEPPVDPLEFAARMWLGAPAMIELQSIELGYTIYLTADDIANLAAFAGDRGAQETLVPGDLPESVSAGLLDERFWEMEDWDQFLRDGREGEFPEGADEAPADPE